MICTVKAFVWLYVFSHYGTVEVSQMSIRGLISNYKLVIGRNKILYCFFPEMTFTVLCLFWKFIIIWYFQLEIYRLCVATCKQTSGQGLLKYGVSSQHSTLFKIWKLNLISDEFENKELNKLLSTRC